MRNRQRGLRPIYYSLYQNDGGAIYDEDGYEIGDANPTYSEPVMMNVNYGPEKKRTEMEVFGPLEEYDLVFSVCDVDCPIDENSRIWVGCDPKDSQYNYIVKRRGTTKNVAIYGLKAVKVS